MDAKTLSFNVLKKNRKYFAALLNDQYKCKIVIDEMSQDLKIGSHQLLVNDLSVKTKYGNDLIFSLVGDAKKQEKAGICTLKHFAYNSWLVARCKKMGGVWDAESHAWVFSDLLESEIEELDEKFNSDLIAIEIKATDELFYHNSAANFAGYSIAYATGRDSGAKLSENISMVEGEIKSGGSMKNWGTKIIKGSVFRFKIPELLLEEKLSESDLSDFWEVKRI